MGDEGKHLMFFPGLMQRQGGTGGHAFTLPGFPPQFHLPLPLPGAFPPPPSPGAYTSAGPGYAYAQAHTYAYPSPPPPPPAAAAAGPFAYPPQGYPLPGSSAPPQLDAGHGSSGGHNSGGRRQIEVTETKTTTLPPPKAGGTATATASATAAYGGGAFSNLFRGLGSSTRSNGAFGRCCGGQQQHGTSSSFKQRAVADHGGRQLGKFKRAHSTAGKVKHVHGKFCSKSTTWKY